MKKLSGFFREKKDILIVAIIFAFLFRFVFFLGNLDQEYFWISIEMLLFFLVIYLGFHYAFYQKRENLKEENQRLLEEMEVFRSEAISTERDLEDYFLLWVHQIKIPITVLKLILEQGLSEKEEEKVRTQLLYIEQYTEMAINYLKLIQINPDMDITNVSLLPLVKVLVKKYSYLFFYKDLRLDLQIKEGLEVISDSKWLSILLEQLLSNALKYTEHGFISIGYQEEESLLFVKDSGSGIRGEDIPKIFDKGYSGYNGRLNQKSSGLGLFLGKKIAERLQIEIQVESKLGEGCRFGLRFLKDRKINLTKL